MKKLVIILMLGVLAACASAVQCITGWQAGDSGGGAYCLCYFYSPVALNGTPVQVRCIYTPMMDPFNNNQPSPDIGPDYPTQTEYCYTGSEGCVPCWIGANGQLWGQQFNAQVNYNLNGYYVISAQLVDPNTGQWYTVGSCSCFCIYGVWSLGAPSADTSGMSGTTNNSGQWDSQGGNYITNKVTVTVTRSGNACGDGISCKLTRTSTGESVTTKLYNGHCSFNPVPHDAYTITISGSAIEGSQTINYSGGTSFTKGNAQVDLTITCDSYGNLSTTAVNGITTAGGSGSGGSGGTTTFPGQSYWQSLMSALFVPQDSTIQGLKNSLSSLSSWGPFGFAGQIHDQLALATGAPDPYWNSGPSINFPNMDPTTGRLVQNSTRSRTDADLSVQWQNETVWQDARKVMGGLVYVMFAMAVLKWIRPRFTL